MCIVVYNVYVDLFNARFQIWATADVQLAVRQHRHDDRHLGETWGHARGARLNACVGVRSLSAISIPKSFST